MITILACSNGCSFNVRAMSVFPVSRVPSRMSLGQSLVTMGIKFWRFGEGEGSCNGIGDDSKSQDLFFQELVIQRLMSEDSSGKSHFVANAN